MSKIVFSKHINSLSIISGVKGCLYIDSSITGQGGNWREKRREKRKTACLVHLQGECVGEWRGGIGGRGGGDTVRGPTRPRKHQVRAERHPTVGGQSVASDWKKEVVIKINKPSSRLTFTIIIGWIYCDWSVRERCSVKYGWNVVVFSLYQVSYLFTSFHVKVLVKLPSHTPTPSFFFHFFSLVLPLSLSCTCIAWSSNEFTAGEDRIWFVWRRSATPRVQ